MKQLIALSQKKKNKFKTYWKISTCNKFSSRLVPVNTNKNVVPCSSLTIPVTLNKKKM